MNEMRKLMEAIDALGESNEADELVTQFEEELDTLLNNFWSFAERVDGGDSDAIQGKMEEVLQSYATAHSVTDLPIEEADVHPGEDNWPHGKPKTPPMLDVGNAEVEQHISDAAKALAKDAVQQAAGVWDEEGRREGGYDTGAKSGKEYVSIAAPQFLDDEYKGAIMREFEKEFNNYVEYFLDYVDAGAEPDWGNAD